MKHSSTVHTAVLIGKRVAITLWKFGTNIRVHNYFISLWSGISTAYVIAHEVCKAIVDVLLKRYISNRMPGNEHSKWI